MKLGIVGLPNVGKSTLFNAITNSKADSANYPFCTIDPNVGVVSVPDERLDGLAKIYEPEKIVPAIIEFVDIAGLVRGASKGEGLGNKFLANIREVDAVIHVVRCFEDGNIIHVDGAVDPARDIDTINYELILSDIEILDRRIDKTKKASKSGDKAILAECELLDGLRAHLEDGKTARSYECTELQAEIIAGIPLLSGKPVIYAANMDETEFVKGYGQNPRYLEVMRIAQSEGAQVLAICAKIEEDISELEQSEKLLFLSELGLEKSGLDRLIQASYTLLGLISYLTAGKPEVRAWTIREGTKAPQAAAVIHTDFERGFIRAEIVAYHDLIEHGSIAACKDKGLVRSEGKEYVMKDGDVVLFRFNV